MTEGEAKTKWCPHALQSRYGNATYNRANNGEPSEFCKCVGSACMAWRWEKTLNCAHLRTGEIGEPREVTTELGYCGLAGKS